MPLNEEATVDAYDESEQMMGFHTVLAEHLEMSFETEVLGVEVTVETLDSTDDDQIAAICMRCKKGAEWVDAYRRWRRGR